VRSVARAQSADIDAARRFAGVERLLGSDAFSRLAAAHVVVIGVGGVGSWAAEALARSGVGTLTLIDLDHVALSNINRQVLALDSTLGAAKTVAMAERIAQIAPDCRVFGVEEFISPDNLEQVLPAQADALIDAIDAPRAKAALIAWCRMRNKSLVVCGAAGGRTDPLALRMDDLALTRGDALLAGVRARLRRDHGFSRQTGVRFGVPAIFSSQPALGASVHPGAGAALACAGYGSLVSVTATMGLVAAQWVIDGLARQAHRSTPAAP
jgi:tRNA threonylcarbamoyladenosine dehydratase